MAGHGRELTPDRPGAAAWIPEDHAVASLRAAAPDCRGCELYADATHVVFSRGTAGSPLMLVGEQPGDQEDRTGEPFVGPAGRLLADAVDAAGIDRGDVYVTNAVKHFRHEERGKRRIHKTPDTAHVVACHPWLEAELGTVAPRVVVALGATAGRAVFGRPVRVGAERGMVQEVGGRTVLLTTHPSAVLRLRGEPGFEEALDGLVRDLQLARSTAG
ncbi:MAG TPA: UdgX family uracil-DNA binding protein [Rhodoglobus sp.]|nr:UdgX family uracil-DNA binding protein [Rhodoglobus sp.]